MIKCNFKAPGQLCGHTTMNTMYNVEKMCSLPMGECDCQEVTNPEPMIVGDSGAGSDKRIWTKGEIEKLSDTEYLKLEDILDLAAKEKRIMTKKQLLKLQLKECKSKLYLAEKLASQRGARMQIMYAFLQTTRTPIPEEIKAWFDKDGVPLS